MIILKTMEEILSEVLGAKKSNDPLELTKALDVLLEYQKEQNQLTEVKLKELQESDKKIRSLQDMNQDLFIRVHGSKDEIIYEDTDSVTDLTDDKILEIFGGVK